MDNLRDPGGVCVQRGHQAKIRSRQKHYVSATELTQDAALRGGLGRTYLEKRDFPDAEQELKRAIALDPENLAFPKDLPTAYYLGRNYAPALALLDEIAKREVPTAGELFIRALCYDKLQQSKAALEAYQKFLAADQNRNPDQVWQAQQRIIVLKKMLDNKR